MTEKKENKKEETKYYVVRPIKESHFDDEFRVVGTKEQIAKYVCECVEECFPWSDELDSGLIDKDKPLIYVEFHAGSRDGQYGFGSHKIFNSEKKAKEWMIKYLSEASIGPIPKSFIFHVEEIYWIKD